MARRTAVSLLALTAGVVAFGLASSLSIREARADSGCNCILYVCPGNPELRCLGKVIGLICDHVGAECGCPACP